MKQTEMKKNEKFVIEKAKSMMKEWGIEGWKIEIMNANSYKFY